MCSKTQKVYFDFLDNLRESGLTNMYASGPPLREAFPELDKAQAREVFFEWVTHWATTENQDEE